MSARNVIPHHLLIVSQGFDARISAERALKAIAAGLSDAAAPEPDVCALPAGARQDAELQALLAELDFDMRMRRARALVLAVESLRESTLAGSMIFELATRARQAGVPCYAVTTENQLDAFDLRVLDLQLVIEARTPRALTQAGRQLAEIA